LFPVLVLVFLVSAAGAVLLLAPDEPQRLVAARLKRIRQWRRRPQGLEEMELEQSFSQRVLVPILRRLHGFILRRTPARVRERVRKRLEQAGTRMEVGTFVAIKVAGTLAGLLGTLVLARAAGFTREAWLVVVSAGVLGYYYPEFALSRRISRRKAAIQRALPDVLDLLCVCVEAGLGLDGAIEKVTEKFREPVRGEFGRYLKEIALGKTRTEAMRSLADRIGLDDMRTFVAAVVQADELGSSISRVLGIQAAAMRRKRRQRAEELAMQTPIKMLFPMVLFIFPVMFIILLGPLVVKYIDLFKP